ncbi:TPA: hypothetical protein N0F65_000731 [Lagenidium giganteum]|uniref:DH domain-containing protein n=1 Tax=Lagenidium giganteum TaxID=4803 RepID=A0AAV2ZKW8_9STRA|nr:TPA: hypothetical protein N0F65_000731 [Lagenidium giganteum]
MVLEPHALIRPASCHATFPVLACVNARARHPARDGTAVPETDGSPGKSMKRSLSQNQIGGLAPLSHRIVPLASHASTRHGDRDPRSGLQRLQRRDHRHSRVLSNQRLDSEAERAMDELLAECRVVDNQEDDDDQDDQDDEDAAGRGTASNTRSAEENAPRSSNATSRLLPPVPLLRHQSSSLSPRTRNMSKPERICAEICATEDAYVTALRDLAVHFFLPLGRFAASNGIDLGAMGTLCSSSDTIVRIHEELLRQLTTTHLQATFVSAVNQLQRDPFADVFSPARRQQSLWSPTSSSGCPSVHQVSFAFFVTVEFMKVYALYCANYLNAQEELAQLQRKNPMLQAFVTELYRAAKHDFGIDIDSNMIKPVQRICRYPLFFRELLKSAEDADDVIIVEQTLDRIEKVSAHVNEKVREAQNNRRLYDLYERLHPSSARIELLLPSRTLLCELTANVVNLDAPLWPSFLRFGRRRSDTLTPPENSRSSSDSIVFPTPPLQSLGRRRRWGEKTWLILLSDVLLMAKKQEMKLKIKRQICLSCAVVRDCIGSPSSPPLSPTPSTSNSSRTTSVTSDRISSSFELAVCKVGRCNCHNLTPSTLKRSPRGFRGLRRNSISQSQASEIQRRLTSCEPRAGSPQQQKRRLLFFTRPELPKPFRTVKRYVVTCESENKKIEFVELLRAAIARCLRLPVEVARMLPRSSASGCLLSEQPQQSSSRQPLAQLLHTLKTDAPRAVSWTCGSRQTPRARRTDKDEHHERCGTKQLLGGHRSHERLVDEDEEGEGRRTLFAVRSTAPSERVMLEASQFNDNQNNNAEVV